MSKLTVGSVIHDVRVESIQGNAVTIPHATHLTHLQFRRFVGCPMCNLHIHSFIQNHEQLSAKGIQEVVVFHSSKQSMLAQHAEAPFALIADPQKTLYKQFGVETSIMALLHPKAWPALIKGLIAHGAGQPEAGESPTGLPADFLIDHTGKVVALKYGTHAYDHWELDEVIALAGQ